MPLGLYTSCQVSAPCGLCSTDGHHRPARRARLLPRPEPHAGGADLVRARPCRVQVPQQRQAPAARRRDARVLAWSCPRRCPGPTPTGPPTSALGQRRADRHLDLARRLSATSAASTRRAGGSSRARSTASSRPGGSPTSGSFIDGVRISDVTLDDLDLTQPPLDPPADRHRRATPRIPAASTSSAAASATTIRTS